MTISFDQFEDLYFRGHDFSEECKVEICDLYNVRYTEASVLKYMYDYAMSH